MDGDDIKLHTARDVCALLKISIATLWRLRRDHDFPRPVELSPNRIAFRAAEISAWLASRERR